MKHTLRDVIYTTMYFFPDPTTEWIERVVWFIERLSDIQTIQFDWDDEGGTKPYSEQVREEILQMRYAKLLKPVERMKSTVGKENRNYKLQQNFYKDCPHFKPDMFSEDMIKALKVFHADRDYMTTFIAHNKNSHKTTPEILTELNDRFLKRGLIKPTKARLKSRNR